MARETKEERLARYAAEQAAMRAEQEATYPARLMKMLERATNENYELSVREGKFILRDRDENDDEPTFALTLTYNDATEASLKELDWRVDLKEDRRLEAERQIAVRKAALAKLTEEERNLLGL